MAKPAPVTIAVEKQDGCTVVTLAGKVEKSAASSASAAIEKALGKLAKPKALVVVDLARFDSESSDPAETMMQLPHTFVENGGAIRFINLSPALLKHFKFFGILHSPKHKDVPTALASMRAEEFEEKIREELEACDDDIDPDFAAEQAAEAAAKAAKAAKASAKPLPAVSAAGWAEAVRGRIGPIATSGPAIRDLCQNGLASKEAIAHKDWPALVEKLIGASMSYGDITENSYGERLGLDQMEEDEGGAMDHYGDEHLYTFDWALTLLSSAAAVKHAKWADLMKGLCRTKKEAVSYYSFGDDEMASLLAEKHVKAHPRYDEIVAAAREAFPFASCFGKGGFLQSQKRK